jgi:hypothetical protein
VTDKRSFAIDLLALVVATVALGTSLKSCNLSKESNDLARQANDLATKNVRITDRNLTATVEHNQLSLLPKLDFRYKFSIGPTAGDGGFLRLVNLGDGIATITNIHATFDGLPLRTDAASLSRIANPYGIRAWSLGVDQVLASKDAIPLFHIDPQVYPAGEVCQKDRERKRFFERLKIDVEYESLYHRRDTVRFRYTSTNNLC